MLVDGLLALSIGSRSGWRTPRACGWVGGVLTALRRFRCGRRQGSFWIVNRGLFVHHDGGFFVAVRFAARYDDGALRVVRRCSRAGLGTIVTSGRQRACGAGGLAIIGFLRHHVRELSSLPSGRRCLVCQVGIELSIACESGRFMQAAVCISGATTDERPASPSPGQSDNHDTVSAESAGIASTVLLPAGAIEDTDSDRGRAMGAWRNGVRRALDVS